MAFMQYVNNQLPAVQTSMCADPITWKVAGRNNTGWRANQVSTWSIL